MKFDFLGAAQSANSNESNSFTPRIRNLYATVDWERLRLAPAGRSVLVAGDHEFQRHYAPYRGDPGGGFLLPLFPNLLDLQGSVLSGKGIGRHGTSQLPDVTFRSDGRIEPIGETDFLVGATLHATEILDVYSYAGEEHVNREAFAGGYGYGSGTVNNAGCLTEGGTCTASTKLIEQLTVGFWQKIYQGPFGRAQVGVQYSYTQRDAFSGINNLAPIVNDNIIFTSFRYYFF